MSSADDFEEFWNAYPNKKGSKSKTKAKYLKFPVDLHVRIMRSIEDQKRARAKAQRLGEFVADWPYAATWINQERWTETWDNPGMDKPVSETPECTVDGCREKQHAPKSDKPFCFAHLERDEHGRFRAGIRMVEELRQEYLAHPERKEWTPEQHRSYIMTKFKGIGRINGRAIHATGTKAGSKGNKQD